MIELALILTLGIITGIAIGLFPVFPIYFGAFILYLVSSLWTPEMMLLFWITASIGSQFFGSVSAITLGIPGDASSLIYIDKIKQLSLTQRNQLLWSTARGSLVGGVMSLALVWILYNVYTAFGFSFLATIEIKFILLLSVVFFTLALSSNKPVALVLAILGLLISPQNNYTLPQEWYTFSIWFQHSTFFMLVLGLMVVPDLVKYQVQQLSKIDNFQSTPGCMPWWLILKNSLLGCVVGLVPGPAAETASATAYSVNHRRPINERIIAAESANNPGVIMMLLPLFLMGLPFTASSLVISNIMDSRMIELPELARSSSSFISSLSVFDSVIVFGLIVTGFYYFFSTRFIDFYARVVHLLQTRMKIVLLIVSIVMMILDAHIQEITMMTYLGLMFIFLALGMLLKYFRISPIPMIFVYLLGDQIIWASTQFYNIYF